MKKIVCIILSIFMFGCVGSQVISQTQVKTLAMDVAYVAYQVSPESKMYIDTICALNDKLGDNTSIRDEIKVLVEHVWVESWRLNQIGLVLAVNNLVALTGLADSANVAVNKLEDLVSGMCLGAKLAAELE